MATARGNMEKSCVSVAGGGNDVTGDDRGRGGGECEAVRAWRRRRQRRRSLGSKSNGESDSSSVAKAQPACAVSQAQHTRTWRRDGGGGHFTCPSLAHSLHLWACESGRRWCW